LITKLWKPQGLNWKYPFELENGVVSERELENGVISERLFIV
jgi:hypothetical protein